MKSILLFTSNFPYGKGEEFVLNEANELASQGFKVTLVPNFIRGEKQKGLDETITIDKSLALQFQSPVFFLKTILFSAQPFLFFLKNFNYLENFNAISYLLKYALGYFGLISWLKQNQTNTDIYFSFWLNYRCHSLVTAKEKRIITAPVITRAHGYDIYDSRLKKGEFWPNRSEILKNLDHIFTISESGKTYLLKKFPNIAKISCIHLGVPPSNIQVEAPNGIIKFVSCSNSAPVKRLDLIEKVIVEFAIRNEHLAIEWLHIGCEIKVPKHKETKNLKMSFVSYLSNEKIRPYYIKHKASIFINLSDSEGIPVTIMEAQSVGIPVLARNVGGISEIVNNQNGILLNKDFSVEEALQGLMIILENWNEKSHNSINNFQSLFNSHFNAKLLIESIKKLN